MLPRLGARQEDIVLPPRGDGTEGGLSGPFLLSDPVVEVSSTLPLTDDDGDGPKQV